MDKIASLGQTKQKELFLKKMISLGRNKHGSCNSLWSMVETEKNSWNWQLAESVKVSWMLPALFLITLKAVEVVACEIGVPDLQELQHLCMWEKAYKKLQNLGEEPLLDMTLVFQVVFHHERSESVTISELLQQVTETK